MQVPLQITFRRMKASEALEKRIRTLSVRLEKFSAQITRCKVVIDGPHHRHQNGERFDVRLDISVPGKEICVRRARPEDPAHADAYVALRDVFDAARRQLQDYERERRLDVKAHTLMARR
jgi:ribosome-associated translation inhibitor RaiA